MQGDASRKVGQYSSAILINGDEDLAQRTQGNTIDIAAMRERQCVRLVADYVRPTETLFSRFQYRWAYLIKSKTVTRFPTGESKQDPVGVKLRSPLR